METALDSQSLAKSSEIEAPVTLERINEKILEALKSALAGDQEHRLFQFGKLPGLFKFRTGICTEAALLALQLGLLESTRTEAKGKLIVEWVRATPAALRFVNEHDSTRAHLMDLRKTLGELSTRVDSALRRIEASECTIPWSVDALTYLDRRITSPCPLRELFNAIREVHEAITLKEFHEGLLRLHELRAVKLSGGSSQSVDPEFALIVGAELCSFVERE